jgi:hypothetical protein
MCPSSKYQINIFEKFSASSWFIVHKLTQDARETKHKILYLGCYRNKSRPEHWLSYDFTLFYAILSDTLRDSVSRNLATATPFHVLSNLLLTNHPITSMLLTASLNKPQINKQINTQPRKVKAAGMWHGHPPLPAPLALNSPLGAHGLF